MCARTLSLDDIFIPEQLLIDCEIRNWVQRAIQGIWLGEEVDGDWLAEMKAGVESGFMTLDSTLDNYKRGMWFPRRFERRPLAPWMNAGQPQFSTLLKAEVRRRIAAHNFELDPARRQEIEKIYLSAEKAVGGLS
jgi:trimethylamine:corrinoid methyltransferase-like protein